VAALFKHWRNLVIEYCLLFVVNCITRFTYCCVTHLYAWFYVHLMFHLDNTKMGIISILCNTKYQVFFSILLWKIMGKE